ncbi:flagellar basal-body rod protein FlgF [Vibrio ponticus]|nr:flagellar basal-body rod protein FlgF [Vibrio ponticus]
MDRSLFLAMSGAKQNMQALQLRANNLANVGTTGFRADLAQARSMQAYGDGLPTRVFSMTERPGHNFQQGSVITTVETWMSLFKVMVGFQLWIKPAKKV